MLPDYERSKVCKPAKVRDLIRIKGADLTPDERVSFVRVRASPTCCPRIRELSHDALPAAPADMHRTCRVSGPSQLTGVKMAIQIGPMLAFGPGPFIRRTVCAVGTIA